MKGVGYCSVPGKYPGLDPRFTGTPTVERKIMTLAPLCAKTMTTHNASVSNLLRGVGERILYTDRALNIPIKPLNGVFGKRMGIYRNHISRAVGRQSPVTRDHFARLYKGPRLSTYLRAVESLAHTAVNPRDAILKTFVKAEKINPESKLDPVPRVIQPRDPRYNVELGRYLKPVEHKIYQAIDDIFGGPTIMSSYDPFAQAGKLHDKWKSFSDPVCVGLDASRFDQHVSADALEFEHELYLSIFGGAELKKLLRWQVNNRGVARARDGWFRYEKKGGRASGDMNTSLGNKFLMCGMAYSYIKTKQFRIEFANNGDDCLLFLERKNLSRISDVSSWFRDFGFKLTLEQPVYVFEQIEFCQARPMRGTRGYRMVRNPRAAILKDMTVCNLGHRVDEFRDRMAMIGQCGTAVCEDIPVMSSFYSLCCTASDKTSYNVRYENEYSYYYRCMGVRSKGALVTELSRYSFYLATGIIPDVQEQLEEQFSSTSWGRDDRQVITNNSDYAPLIYNLLFQNEER